MSADRELTNDPREMDRRFDNEVSKIATDRLARISTASDSPNAGALKRFI